MRLGNLNGFCVIVLSEDAGIARRTSVRRCSYQRGDGEIVTFTSLSGQSNGLKMTTTQYEGRDDVYYYLYLRSQERPSTVHVVATFETQAEMLSASVRDDIPEYIVIGEELRAEARLHNHGLDWTYWSGANLVKFWPPGTDLLSAQTRRLRTIVGSAS